MGDLGPEFAKHVVTHVAKNAETYSSRGWRKSALVARVIHVAQADRARRSQPFRKIEHAIAIVGVSHKRVLDRMQETLPATAVDQTVVSGVLVKYRGIRKVFEEHERGLIGIACAKPLAISGHALSEGGVFIFRLAESRVETGAEKYHGID